MKLLRSARAALCGIAVAASLPLLAQDKPATLARSFKKGDVARFKAESSITANGMEITATITSRNTVKEVKDNGQVVVEQEGEGGKVTVGGMDMDIPPSPPVTVTRDKAGKLVDFKMDENAQGLTTPDITRLMAIIGSPILADKEVKAGDSWENEFDNPAARGKKIKLKTTYVGLDKVDGADYWKIKQSAEPETDANGTKMGYEATYWLDPTNGQEAKTEANIKDLPTNFGPLTMKTITTRVKDAAK